MRNPFLRLAITALLLIVIHDRGLAQTGQQPSNTKAYRVQGLTSDDRDQLARELAIDGECRIAFACVPAGILVIEAMRGKAVEPAMVAATSRLQARLPGRMPVPDDRSMTELEEACSVARNQ